MQSEVFQKCLKWVVYINTLLSPLYHLDRNGRLLKSLRILITTVYFKDQNWISETMFCISCPMVCKVVFCSKFPDILDNTGKVMRRRRRTQAIAKRYAFHANAKITCIGINGMLLELISFFGKQISKSSFKWSNIMGNRASWCIPFSTGQVNNDFEKKKGIGLISGKCHLTLILRSRLKEFHFLPKEWKMPIHQSFSIML